MKPIDNKQTDLLIQEIYGLAQLQNLQGGVD